jgi:hypothetical protein
MRERGEDEAVVPRSKMQQAPKVEYHKHYHLNVKNEQWVSDRNIV